MRRIQFIFCFLSIICTQWVSAQAIQLIENKGEIGIMGGSSYYHGDIASDMLFYKPNFGAFYKKQMNDYVGIRLNYEYIALAANDLQSTNVYDHARALNFERVAHDISVMGEFYFLKFINGNKLFRFSPYLGFGIGAWKSISGRYQWYDPINNTFVNQPQHTQRTISFPINLGYKYNLFGPWNVFGEITYRFTNSDRIDYFGMDDKFTEPQTGGLTFQPSTSGNDQYFSAKMGISYNLLKIYGPDKPKKPSRTFFKSKEEKQQSVKRGRGLLSFFKRN